MSLVFEIIKTKRAVRLFRTEDIPQEVVRQILDAGRLSGSAKNSQPWHFVAVQRQATLEALSKCGAYAAHLASAALGIALVTKDPFQRLTVPFDLGRAAQNMMLTAWSHGIGSVMATIYQTAHAREILGIPPTHTIPWCMSFGYPSLVEDRRSQEGGRRPAADVLHWEQW